MAMTFNLVTEPWIPASTVDGAVRDVSLAEAFTQSRDIRRLGGDIPTQPLALLRLMLAICHDAIGFPNLRSVAEAIDDGIDVEAVQEYLIRYQGRFDLFDAKHPFYQVAGLRTGKDAVSGLEKIVADVPNGQPFLTVRSAASLERIPAAEAARWLMHAQAFDPSGIRSGAVGDPLVKGGRGYPIGPSWVGQLGGVVIHGDTLADTLAYNLVPLAKQPGDRPVWTREEPQSAVREVDAIPRGPIEVLTWQSRRIRLVGDAEGVTGVILSQGDQLKPQNRWDVEHMTAWRYSKPQTAKAGIDVYMPLKHDADRSSWRGLPALLGQSPRTVDGKAATLPPGTLKALGGNSKLTDPDLSFKVGIEVVGMTYGAQEAVVEELVHDSMDLRVSLLASDALEVRALVADAVTLADDVVRELGKLAANMARASGDLDGTDGALGEGKRAAWSAIDFPARAWIAELSSSTDVAEAMREWKEILRDIALAEIRRQIDFAGPAAVTGRTTKYGFMSSSLAGIYAENALRKLLSTSRQVANEEEA